MTSMERLKNKNVRKGKTFVEIAQSGAEQKSRRESAKVIAQQIAPTIKAQKADTNNPIVNDLKPAEQRFFAALISLYEEKCGASDDFHLALAHLAKLYAMQEEMEAIVAQDGYMVEGKFGRTSHPLLNNLQRVHANIMRDLKSLGLTQENASKLKSEAKSFTVSDFQQFH